MRRISAKPPGIPAREFRPPADIPAAEELRRFASECHDLAETETDAARRRLFRQMESAWLAVSAQVERTDDLILKLRAIQHRSMN
jgi:hypothetical protein